MTTKRFGALVCLALLLFAVPAGSQTLTNILDTLRNADNTLPDGRLEISWPGFETAGGFTVASGHLTYTVTAGTVSLNLFPNAGATPAGTSYRVDYFLTSGSGTEHWVVTATTPDTIANIRVSVAPTPTVNIALDQLPIGTANQLFKTNAGATSTEHATLAVGTAGTDFAIVHSSGTITFNLPDASATARGAVTTGAQTFAGVKTLTSPVLAGTPQVGDGAGNDKLEFIEEASNPTCAAGDFFLWANSGDNKIKKCENGSISDVDTDTAVAHALLSATHTDTLAAAVVRGDLEIGNATPAWARLPIGLADRVLTSDGTDPSWGQVTDAALANNYSGIGACAADNFVNDLNDNAAPGCAQVNFTNLAGTATKGQLPAAVAYEDEVNIFTLAGGVTLDNQLGIRLRELTVSGTDYVAHRSVGTLTGNTTYTWPATTDSRFLFSGTAGALSWNQASGVGSCAANTFATALNNNAAPTCTQPDFTDLAGTATKGQLPAAVAYEDEVNIFTLAGGVTLDNQLGIRLRELTVSGTDYVAHRSVGTLTGNTTYTWPATTDSRFLFSGTAGALSWNQASGVGSCAANTFATALNNNAAPTCTQPDFTDLAGTATKGQLPAAVAYEDEPNIFTLAGGVTLDNQLELRLRELTASGTDYVAHRSVGTLTGNTTYTWPGSTDSRFLFSGTSGALSWNQASGVGSCAANTFATALNNNAAPTCTQPDFTNLAGSATKGQLPAAVAYEDEPNIFTLAGGVTLDNQLELRLRELTASGTDYVAHRSVGTLTGNTTYGVSSLHWDRCGFELTMPCRHSLTIVLRDCAPPGRVSWTEMKRHALLLGLVLTGALWGQRPELPPADAPVLAALQKIMPALRYANVIERMPGENEPDLLLVLAGRRPLHLYVTGKISWTARSVFALVLEKRDREPDLQPEILAVLNNRADDSCCATRVLQSTRTEIVLSRGGEKSRRWPHLKAFVDVASRSVEVVEYRPFAILETRDDDGLPLFVAGDRTAFRVLRARPGPPYLELLNEEDAAPIVSTLDIEVGSIGWETVRTLRRQSEVVRFGADGRFRFDPATPDRITETTGSGLRDHHLPQSTLEEVARLRSSEQVGLEIEETIGPHRLVGSRLWFGKTFHNSEGFTGVGGLGFFDAAGGAFETLSPQEIRDWSVSAMAIDRSVAWAALAHRGEWGNSAGGLLRIDTGTGQVDTYPVPFEVSEVEVFADRLYLASRDGITILFPDAHIEHYFVDLSADGSYQLTRWVTIGVAADQ